jgi:hypothetical protein|tara:strand:- start:105 stop:323 length:219 start_codon:yes stop_codon:yes gene_type:complete
LNSGVLVETEVVHVHVTDVSTSKVLLVVRTILKQYLQKLVALIQFVLVEFIDVVLESVTDVTDVLHTLMVIT